MGHPAFAARVRGQGRIVPEAGKRNARIVDGGAVVPRRSKRMTALEEVGGLALKGLSQPVSAFDVPLAGGTAAH
jgi:hypothetical protein